LSKIVLRMDDVGASTKHFEVYSKKIFGNFLFLKYLPYFRAWGVYDEISSEEWKKIFDYMDVHGAKLTIGVTAAWVEQDSTLIEFPEKFPRQAEVLKEASASGLVEIANHGLTHCVVGKHLPRLFSSNRQYHREFWDWLPEELHESHLRDSQKIFQSWLGSKCETLIPPGNVYSKKTLKACKENGIIAVNSSVEIDKDSTTRYINDENVDAFHDREIVLLGRSWLFKKIEEYKKKGTEFLLIKDLKHQK